MHVTATNLQDSQCRFTVSDTRKIGRWLLRRSKSDNEHNRRSLTLPRNLHTEIISVHHDLSHSPNYLDPALRFDIGAACRGCGSINSHLAAGMGEVIPEWAGGLPADAPPRPGTAKYDEMMKERERERLEPAKRDDAAKPSNPMGAIR